MGDSCKRAAGDERISGFNSLRKNMFLVSKHCEHAKIYFIIITATIKSGAYSGDGTSSGLWTTEEPLMILTGSRPPYSISAYTSKNWRAALLTRDTC